MQPIRTHTMLFVALFCSVILLEAGSGTFGGNARQTGTRKTTSTKKPAVPPKTTDSKFQRQQTTNTTKPTFSPQQQANLQKLQSDLTSMKSQSQVTPDQKKKLSADLQTLAEGTVKPSKASVDQLAADLSAATANSSISKAEQAKLMQDISAVLNSANIPP